MLCVVCTLVHLVRVRGLVSENSSMMAPRTCRASSRIFREDTNGTPARTGEKAQIVLKLVSPSTADLDQFWCVSTNSLTSLGTILPSTYPVGSLVQTLQSYIQGEKHVSLLPLPNYKYILCDPSHSHKYSTGGTFGECYSQITHSQKQTPMVRNGLAERASLIEYTGRT